MSFKSLFQFEEALAKYTGSQYAVVTDSCTHALELCFRHLKVDYCEFTAFTYLSIVQLMHQLDIKYTLRPVHWESIGEYQFYDTRIWDSARLLRPNMYRQGQLQCLSFGHGKPLSIGRAGAILLDDKDEYEIFSRMRSDGRDLRITPWENQLTFGQGYHYCPTLETCDIGIDLLPHFRTESTYHKYPDLRLLDFQV